MLVTPSILIEEIQKYSTSNRTLIDNQCGIIEEAHMLRDSTSDYLKNIVGTTGTWLLVPPTQIEHLVH